MTNPPLIKQPAATLQALCASCGLKKSGTKAALVQRLRRAARRLQPLPPTARILSIDLGLRNFAFCLLSPAAQQPPASPPQQPASSPAIITSPVHLHAWHRLDLTLPSTRTPPPPEADQTKGTQEPNPDREELERRDREEVEEEGDDDEFSPAALAALALRLATTHLLPLRPSHVLIERQRFRTAGGAAIFEWTLRVNTLEAMLHAVLATLRRGRRSGIGARAGAGDDDDVAGTMQGIV
ncbi:b40b04f9-dc7e-414f-94f4-fc5e559071d6 [Thermothielavioides terrestris]|uniref:B40b04f9-dc7e-414f-94f4-fc5e559071d6 n=1 Tax=Thermothielavioides terrestris TaxID=2587410 RepID=A0A3S4EZN1_9PEZI|nr:b40b04f9-dc7e-414f-94f4-fc5e559071d6 [Thermothielavioides terrestris]